MSEITIESLIEQGNRILTGISCVSPAPNTIRFAPAYKLGDVEEYTTWKHKTIRFISSKFPQDSYIPELNKQFEEFERYSCRPAIFQQILGLIKAYKEIPETVVLKTEAQMPIVEVNNNLSQHQSLSLQLIVDIIKDELTGRQQRELKDIIESDVDTETKKKNIFEKIKSFGSDLATSILANILTNPSIYGSFLNI